MTARPNRSLRPAVTVLTVLLTMAALTRAAAAGEQLTTLGDPDGPRFAITEKVWPAAPGEAHVCLWKNDAHAAVSITIDDNTAPDHAWWAATMADYDVKVTWFIITCLVDSTSYGGSWAGFQDLADLGHDIQSHTVTHLNFDRGFDPNDPAHDIVAEYRDSQATIDEHIDGPPCLTIAYPGGTNSGYNDHAVAADFYIAGRGGVGGVINPANEIHWMGTASVSGGLAVVNESAPWNQLINLFDPAAYRANLYRGWYCTHFHAVNDALKAQITAGLNYLAQKDAEVGVWIGTFREVALYGQSRDSAALVVDSVAPERIVFTLTDRMHDGLFDYPLTVKVRLPDDWSDLHAAQAGEAVNAVIVEHNGAPFALVNAVADRGAVELTRAPAGRPGDIDGDDDVDIDDFVILKNHFGARDASRADGDLNGDGAVDINDFIILKNDFGPKR